MAEIRTKEKARWESAARKGVSPEGYSAQGLAYEDIHDGPASADTLVVGCRGINPAGQTLTWNRADHAGSSLSIGYTGSSPSIGYIPIATE
jgi:hypothetical protein